MPVGFKLNDFKEIEDGSPSLSKSCFISEYLLNASIADRIESVKKVMFILAESKLISCGDEGEFIRFTVNNNLVTIGAIVRELISLNAVSGWHELRIVRVRVGGVNDGQ